MTGELLNTGYAALAESDDKFIARGMALGAGDVTQGGSGKATYWPEETLKEAADSLAGQPLATSADHTADGPQAQTPPEAIVGEVRWSDFGEVDGKAGVLYEAEVDDEDIARNVDNQRIEVSPLVFRDVVEADEYDGEVPENADYVATKIKKWRDLATVRRGASPSASIEPGEVAAMSAEALSEAVVSAKHGDESAESDADTQSDDGTDGGESQSSVADANEDTMTDDNDLTREEEAVLSAAESLESPVEALEAFEAAEQPSIVDESDNQIVPTDEYESLQEQVEEVESIMSEALGERTDLKESTIEALSFEALCDEFRDDEGNLEVEALVQEPETEEVEDTDEAEALSEDTLEDARAIKSDIDALGTAAPESLKEDLADLVDEESYEDAVEVL